MSKLQEYIDRALSSGISEVKTIKTEDIVVGNWVRMKCQYGCGSYGNHLTCPPYSPTPSFTQRMINEYSTALLMQIQEIPAARELKMSRKLRHIVAALERGLFLDGYYKVFGMASGPCRLCRKCDTKKPCRYPDVARPSMEACGIDVYQTARNAGFRLEVVRTKDSCCTYNGLILVE